MPTSTLPRAAVLAALVLATAAAGCRGVDVSDERRPFDAATETLRAEAAQLAARADSRLRTLTDSSAAARLRASRDSLTAAIDNLATAADSGAAGSRASIRDLEARILDRLGRADSLAVPVLR